ncbi:MAG: (Fe-S)-binding protein [Acidobacteria bacterium]|nr:(Fe-S)-binding protein [Acidobacteriota bacterium]
MSPIAMTIVLIVSFGGFFYFLNRKVAIMLALQKENRWEMAGVRLKKVFTLGFFQNKMITGEPKAGLMHAVIFWGFCTLLIRKMHLIAIGYSSMVALPEWIGGPYAAFKDFIEIAVVLAVGYAFYRRLVIKPRRLEPNKEALFILSLILTIMVTDFLYDGFKFALYSSKHPALAHEQSYAFVGNFLAGSFSGMDQGLLTAGFHGFYWLQIATVFFFLVFLPIGEHFHIVTALPTLFFSHNSPLNKVPKVDLEALLGEGDSEEEPKVGVKNAGDLIWKDALDVFTCTECGRCKDSCPTFLTDKPLSLKWVNDSLKHHLMDKKEVFKTSKDLENDLPDLVGEIINPDTLWACTTCGYCESACPIELEHLGKFYKMRQYKVMMDGDFPAELQDVFGNYERQGNPWGLNSAKRGDWAAELDIPILEDAEQAKELDYLFYVGSAQSFDNRNQKVAKAFAKVLKAAGIKFAILGAQEGSTGECVRRAGNEMLFQQLSEMLITTFKELEVTKIVTCDPHAYNSLKNEYPEFGGKYEVIHHSELMADLLAKGKIKVTPQFEKVIFHEPCYLGRHNKVYDEPRRVLQAVVKDTPLEFAMNREKSMCCGAGGGRMWMEETIGTRINVTRVEQALSAAVEPKVIATACPYCTIMMTDGVAHHGKEEQIETKDIAELVAESLVMEV